MSELFMLSRKQFNRIKPYFPLSHGVPRVDDLWVISGIIYVIRNGLQWKDASRGYGPPKTLYNCFVRWSRKGIFNRIFSELAGRPLCQNSCRVHQVHSEKPTGGETRL